MKQRLQAGRCQTSAMHGRRAADDPCSRTALKQDADSELAAAAIDAIAVADEAPCTAVSQWRTTDSRITCGGKHRRRVNSESPGGLAITPPGHFRQCSCLGAGRIVVCKRAVPTVGERERGVRGAAD